jgi:hypothetical protein
MTPFVIFRPLTFKKNNRSIPTTVSTTVTLADMQSLQSGLGTLVSIKQCTT